MRGASVPEDVAAKRPRSWDRRPGRKRCWRSTGWRAASTSSRRRRCGGGLARSRRRVSGGERGPGRRGARHREDASSARRCPSFCTSRTAYRHRPPRPASGREGSARWRGPPPRRRPESLLPRQRTNWLRRRGCRGARLCSLIAQTVLGAAGETATLWTNLRSPGFPSSVQDDFSGVGRLVDAVDAAGIERFRIGEVRGEIEVPDDPRRLKMPGVPERPGTRSSPPLRLIMTSPSTPAKRARGFPAATMDNTWAPSGPWVVQEL